MTTQEKFEKVKEMADILNFFIKNYEEETSVFNKIQTQMIVDYLYNGLNPILGAPIQY